MLKGKLFWTVFLTLTTIIFIGSIIMITIGNQCANGAEKPNYCNPLLDGGGIIIQTLGGIFLGLDITGFVVVNFIICTGICGVRQKDYTDCCA